MNKLLAASLIPTFLLSLFKCTFGGNAVEVEPDRTDEYRPSTIVEQSHLDNYKLIFDDYEYELRGISTNENRPNEANILGKIIRDATFISVDSSEITDSKSFIYSVSYRFFLSTTVYAMQFYYDGFVQVNNKYCYSFDKDQAQELYDTASSLVEAYKQEEQEKASEEEIYKAKMDNLTLQDVLNDINNQNPLVMDFRYALCSSTKYETKRDDALEDDGAIKPIVVSSTYTLISVSHDPTRDLERVTDIAFSGLLFGENPNEAPIEYKLIINEETLTANLSAVARDKFNRYYARSYYYDVDRTVVHNIFDNVYRLYDAKHPVETAEENTDR